MQWSLFLLILMVLGQCSFFKCHRYKYHFIKKKKTWEDAQRFCRENYTDLATVFDMTDMADMTKMSSEVAKTQSSAWIGLYNKTGDGNWGWQWSLPGVEYKTNQTKWKEGQPDGLNERCAFMENHKWWNFPCSTKYNFICYDEKNTTNKFYFGKDNNTWPEAQSYCRERHTDLLSGLNQLKDVKQTSEIEQDTRYWIGLFTDTWGWSDESRSSFRNWDNNSDHSQQVNKRCAMTTLREGGRWNHDDCDKEKPFICYDDKMILIKENMTWVEALYYCRENHYDLVSITDPYQQRWVQDRAKNASTSHVWLGLRYTCTLDFWFWVSDKRVSYTNWASGGKNDSCDMSAAMESRGDHKWYKKSDDKKFNFICALE